MATTDREQGAGAMAEVPTGALVKDAGRKGKVGVVMGLVGPYVQLRPPGGGLEWEVKPDNIEELTAREELSARLAVRNGNSRWGL